MSDERSRWTDVVWYFLMMMKALGPNSHIVEQSDRPFCGDPGMVIANYWAVRSYAAVHLYFVWPMVERQKWMRCLVRARAVAIWGWAKCSSKGTNLKKSPDARGARRAQQARREGVMSPEPGFGISSQPVKYLSKIIMTFKSVIKNIKFMAVKKKNKWIREGIAKMRNRGSKEASRGFHVVVLVVLSQKIDRFLYPSIVSEERSIAYHYWLLIDLLHLIQKRGETVHRRDLCLSKEKGTPFNHSLQSTFVR